MDNKILISPNGQMCWIYILGNVDQLINIFKNANWKFYNNVLPKKSFVILDDPLSRWMNAVVLEYNQNHEKIDSELHYDPLINFILNYRITDHPNIKHQQTIIQQFVGQNEFVKVTYFQKNFNLGYLLNHFLHDNAINNQLNNSLTKDIENFEQINTISNFLFDSINRPYLNKILKYLHNDYEFYKSINFYAR